MGDNTERDLITELLSGTDFEIMTDSRILTSRRKVRTPIESLNCFLGGGIPLGIVAHVWGEPKAGKSTILYQMMGYFQNDYPEGISVIIDMESSADPVRLSALGVDVSSVVRLPATSIESGFVSLKQLINNKENTDSLKNVPIFVIWDTISKGLATDSTIQSRMAAMDRARVIKGYMGELTKSIEKHDFFLGLLNQIIYTTDRYGNRKATYGGGIALTHECQISIQVSLNNDNYDNYNMLVSRSGRANIDKSKISPEIRDIPYTIDVRNGTSIDPNKSLIDYMIHIGWIDPGKSGWYSLGRTFENELNDEVTNLLVSRLYNVDKKYRWNDFYGFLSNDELILLLSKHVIMRMIELKYTLQANVVKEYHEKTINELVDFINNKHESGEIDDELHSEVLRLLSGSDGSIFDTDDSLLEESGESENDELESDHEEVFELATVEEGSASIEL